MRDSSWLLVLTLLLVSGGRAASADIPVLTVCELLADLERYNGQSIIVVGRLISTGEGQWLDQDCKQKLVTEGHAWLPAISISYTVRDTEPPELPEKFKWDEKLLARKLKEAQKGTKFLPPENWVAEFGRLEAHLPLKLLRAGEGVEFLYGFGHGNEAPAQLVGDVFHRLK